LNAHGDEGLPYNFAAGADARVGWNGERSKRRGARVFSAVWAVVGQLR